MNASHRGCAVHAASASDLDAYLRCAPSLTGTPSSLGLYRFKKYKVLPSL
jgi:hypothetical protein